MKPKLKIWIDDLMNGAPKVPDCSVDVVFTSPPYKKKDGYSHELMERLGEVLGRVLRPGGRVFLNFGQLRESFDRPGVARDLVYEGSDRALEPGQTIAWIKSVALPGWRVGALRRVKEILKGMKGPSWTDVIREELWDLQDYLEAPGEVLQRGHYQAINRKSPTLNYCWEPIFTFFKTPELALNRLAIGCPFADKSNLKRGTRGRDGDLHCAGDTWFVPYKTTGAKKKKATVGMGNAYSFPVELPRRAIKVSNLAKGCVVFDPFMGCYDAETFVAIRRGFVPWPDVVDGDEFLSRSEDGQIEYRQAESVIRKPYKGVMHRYSARSLDLLVTPDHKMLVREHHGGSLELVPSKDMAKRTYHVPNTGVWAAETPAETKVAGHILDTISWARFLGLFIAEGSVNWTGRGCKVEVKQVKSQKSIDAVRSVMLGLGVGVFWEWDIPSGGKLFRVQDKGIHSYMKGIGRQPVRRIPREALGWGRAALEALYEGMMLGDVSPPKIRAGYLSSAQYFTSSPGLAMDMAELMVKLGSTATISTRYRCPSHIKGRKIELAHPSMTVIRRTSRETKIDRLTMLSKVDHGGVVYCADVPPHHTLLVMRNGKVSWCGNSGTTAVAARPLGMHAWGIEMDASKKAVIEQRWKEAGDGRE